MAEQEGIIVGRLPLRLIRDMESLSRISLREADDIDELKQSVKGRILADGGTVKRDSFKTSANRQLVSIGERTSNGRVAYKYHKLHDQVANYLERHTVDYVRASMDRHSLGGFSDAIRALIEGRADLFKAL